MTVAVTSNADAAAAAARRPRPRVVIIGGGFGGLNAAKGLAGAPVRVTLIDRRNFHLFQPLLYQVATGIVTAADVAQPLRNVFRNQANLDVLLGEVIGVDAESRNVRLDDGTSVPYDTLVLAAGSVSHYFGNARWAEIAPGLKSLEDARAVRARIVRAFEHAERETDPAARRAWLTFAIVGGGPTGVELAGQVGEIARGALRGLYRHSAPERARVVLIQLEDRVLPAYPPDLSERAREKLRGLGVSVWQETMVTDLHADGITVRRKGREENLDVRTVLWAAGVRAAPLGKIVADAAGLAADRGGRVPVDPELRVPGHPEIFAIGDIAAAADGEGTLPGVAPVAIQEGQYVARRIREEISGGKPGAAFRYSDRGTMATIGRGSGVAVVKSLHFDGFVGWVMWLFVHLLYLVGFQARVVVVVRWLWVFLTRRRPGLLITDVDGDRQGAKPEPTGAAGAAVKSGVDRTSARGDGARTAPGRDGASAADGVRGASVGDGLGSPGAEDPAVSRRVEVAGTRGSR